MKAGVGDITDILDPNVGDIHYSYNGNGDLTSVTQRDNESNGARGNELRLFRHFDPDDAGDGWPRRQSVFQKEF